MSDDAAKRFAESITEAGVLLDFVGDRNCYSCPFCGAIHSSRIEQHHDPACIVHEARQFLKPEPKKCPQVRCLTVMPPIYEACQLPEGHAGPCVFAQKPA